MEVPFKLEQEARLAKTAALAGTNAPSLVKAATLQLLEEDSQFRPAVLEAQACADRKVLIEAEEMDAFRRRQLTGNACGTLPQA